MSYLFERNFFKKAVRIDRRVHLPPGKLLLDSERFLLKTEHSFRFSGAESSLREHAALFAFLQAPENGEEHRDCQTRAKSRSEHILPHFHQPADGVVGRMFFRKY